MSALADVKPGEGLAKAIKAPELPLSGKTFLLLASAGSSTRFGTGKKEFLKIEGESVLQRALLSFMGIESLQAVIITYPKGLLEETRSALSHELLDCGQGTLPLGIRFCEGGTTRQDSVYNGLCLIEEMTTKAGMDTDSAIVLIHDAARPWLQPETAESVLESVRRHGACIPLDDLPDTPKIVAEAPFIEGHPARDSIKAAQTPQGFALAALLKASRAARQDNRHFTDDAALWAYYVGPVAFVQGDRRNRKITYREDFPDAARQGQIRIGEGWDIHRLVPGRKLLLGGVQIDFALGELGHSDGDVLWHAVIDAMLGACALGDIGTHFPPGDPAWKDADSADLARRAAALVKAEGWKISNIDSTVILEKPKLGPYREAICASIGRSLGIATSSVSFKAKTNEGLDAVGRGEAVMARAIVLLTRQQDSTHIVRE